jgi:hypothetical protein
MVNARYVATMAAAVALAGCAPTGLYDWGSYDDSVRALYEPTAINNPSIEKQIRTLQNEIHETESHAKPNTPSRVPPGKYAHLGYLYTMSGDKAAARHCFETEKVLYPESSVFIDGLLARMN